MQGITSITIPDSVTKIGHGAFAHCGNLKTVVLPNNIKEIGEEAFDGYWKSKGSCKYCGGTFKGLFSKTCTKCGEPKDY